MFQVIRASGMALCNWRLEARVGRGILGAGLRVATLCTIESRMWNHRFWRVP